jgi:type I restriction enzyme S subunit
MNSGWKEMTLAEAEVILIDCVHKTPISQIEGIPYIGIPQLNKGHIDFEANPRLISEEDYIEWTKKANPKHNDVILSRRTNPGVTAHVPINKKFALGQNLVIMRSIGKIVYPPYLRWLLRGPDWWNQISKFLNVGAIFDSLRCGDIPNFVLKIPPYDEQISISCILNNMDDKIALNRQMNQTLEAMAQALFKSWFVDFDPVMDNVLENGGEIPEELQAMAEKRRVIANRSVIASDEGAKQSLNPSSKRLINTNPALAAQFPSAFEYNVVLGKWVPEGWEVKSFGELIEATIGGDWGKDLPDEKHTEEVKIIRGTDIPSLINCDLDSAPTRYVELKKLKTRQLEVGDIVIEVSGGSPTQSTGRSIRLTESILERLGGIVEPASFCRRMKPINKEFSVLCSEQLTYIYGIGKMWEYQNQSTGISNFQTTYFLEAEMVLIPSNDGVLKTFYSHVSSLKNKATSNENLALTRLRDRLLPELISGRVRVKDRII